MSARGRVLVVGAGGLGSPAALALAAAPDRVSHLSIVDPDQVELSNLHRQILHGPADLGIPKVASALMALGRRAPLLEVLPIAARLEAHNAARMLVGHDVIIEGSDSIETKFLVSDTAVRLGIPVVIGGVVRWAGQVLTVLPGQTACYRCLFEDLPDGALPSCQDAGVMGPSCGVVGALQAGEALHLLCGRAPAYAGAVLVCDLLAGSYRRVPLSRRPDCPVCQAPGKPEPGRIAAA